MDRELEGARSYPIRPMSKREKLARRTIRDMLVNELRLEAVSHVDGSIDVREPRSTDAQDFRRLVRERIEQLGFEPRIVSLPRSGDRWIRITTKETLAQEGRGAHSS